MAKYIIDTNVFISALWNKRARKVIEKILKEKDKILMCKEILDEYNLIINRLFDKNIISNDKKKELKGLFKKILNNSKIVKVIKKVELCRDSKDDIFLSLALQEKAHYIVTGDNDLIEIDKKLLLKAGMKKLKIIRIAEV